jgi:hypothetical protein
MPHAPVSTRTKIKKNKPMKHKVTEMNFHKIGVHVSCNVYDLVDRYKNICGTNDHGYDPLVTNTSRSFPHSRLITGFVTRLTRRVPLVEQELLTLPEHMSSPPVLVGLELLDL